MREASPTIYPDVDSAIEAADKWYSPIHSIRHVVQLDGGWAVIGHINCKDCSHCGDYPLNWTKHAITIDCEQAGFRAFLKYASQQVASWPAWKRNCLINALKAEN